MDIPITFQLGTFTWTSGDPEDLKDAIVAALVAIVSDTNILLGKIGGAQPTDGSIWFTLGSWWYLNGSVYQPVKVRVGSSATANILLISNATAARQQTLQDKDGIIALTSDVYTPRDTRVVAGSTPTIDWSLSNSFYQTAAGNSLPVFTNSLPGQEINFIVVQTASGKATVFPSLVQWADGGVQPAQTSPGTDLWNFRNVAGQIFGMHYPDYA